VNNTNNIGIGSSLINNLYENWAKIITPAATLLTCVTEELVIIPTVVLNILKLIVVFLWPYWQVSG